MYLEYEHRFACLKSSRLYSTLKTLKLTENMSLKSMREDPQADCAALKYLEYLLDIGEGNIEADWNDMVALPPSIENITSVDDIISAVFPDLATNFGKEGWLTPRAILATKNSQLQEIKELIAEKLPREDRTYLSADSAEFKLL